MSEQNKMISGKEEKQKMAVGSFYNQDGSFGKYRILCNTKLLTNKLFILW
jgi:hypothetical protein